MKNEVTEVVFVLDRSGSMGSIVDDTIGGFNSVLKQQQEINSQAYITTCLFDDRIEWLHDHLDLQDVKPIDEEDYYVRGCTALYDAIGLTIGKIKNIVKHNNSGKVVFIIITDGRENASKEYGGKKIKKLIEQCKEEGWEFLFLGANIDAFETAESIGINRNRAANWVCDSQGMDLSMKSVSNAVRDMRLQGMVEEDCLQSVNQDYCKRKEKSM